MNNGLLHKNNHVNFGAFGIVLVLNFAHIIRFLNLFGCRVVRGIFFIIKWFLKFSICSAFNVIFKFVERKLMIRIVRSTESNKIFHHYFRVS